MAAGAWWRLVMVDGDCLAPRPTVASGRNGRIMLPGGYGIAGTRSSGSAQASGGVMNHGSAGVDKGVCVGVFAGVCWYGYRCQVVVQSQSKSQETSGNVQSIIHVLRYI